MLLTLLKRGWRGPQPVSTFAALASELGLRDPVVFEADGNRAPREEIWKWPEFDIDVHVVDDHLAGCGYVAFNGTRVVEAAAALASCVPLWSLEEVLVACRSSTTMRQALPFLGVLPDAYSDEVMHALADALLTGDEAIELCALNTSALLGFEGLGPLVFAASKSSPFETVRALAADIHEAMRIVAARSS